MRTTLAALLTATALALSACGGSSSGEPAATTAAPSGSAGVSGEQVAAEQSCQGCHQLPSGGAPGPGPDLTAIGAQLSADQIADTLRQGPGSMPSFAKLESDSPAQFRALVSYLAGLKG